VQTPPTFVLKSGHDNLKHTSVPAVAASDTASSVTVRSDVPAIPKPTAQEQSVISEEPAADSELAGHAVHPVPSGVMAGSVAVP